MNPSQPLVSVLLSRDLSHDESSGLALVRNCANIKMIDWWISSGGVDVSGPAAFACNAEPL